MTYVSKTKDKRTQKIVDSYSQIVAKIIFYAEMPGNQLYTSLLWSYLPEKLTLQNIYTPGKDSGNCQRE